MATISTVWIEAEADESHRTQWGEAFDDWYRRPPPSGDISSLVV